MLGDVMTAEGQSVTYSRGPESLPITAMPDGPQAPVATLDGQTITRGEMDFGISFVDLESFGFPADGDEVLGMA